MAIDPNDVRIVLDGFEKRVFVRSAEGDDKPGWAIDLLPYLTALARLQAAIEEDGDADTDAPLGRDAQDIRSLLFNELQAAGVEVEP
jgi:hypothetical protein